MDNGASGSSAAQVQGTPGPLTEESKPSGSSSSAALLEMASQQYKEGVQYLRINELEKAVELLGEALQSHISAFGELGEECAAVYHRYGAALFYKAQEDSDVFGAPLRQAALAQEPEPAAANAAGSADGQPAPAGSGRENADAKGKAPMRAEDLAAASGAANSDADDGDEDGDDAAEGEGGGEEEGEGEEGGDMQLAWEMLEVARTIYAKSGDAGVRALGLADVHMLLGDLALETERFDSARADYGEGLRLLTSALEADDRRIAEAQYKLALALHFADAPEDALVHARAAVDVCAARIARLSAPAPEGAAAAAAGPEPAAAGAAAAEEEDAKLAAEREVADLRGVLGDLAAKVEELEAAVAEAASTRDTLKAAFARLAGPQLPLSGGASVGGSSSGAPAEPEAVGGSGSSGGVVNLGVVGRGSKRITLQPTPAEGGAAVAASGAAGPAAPKKRSLDDLMGSGAGSTVGFGAPMAVPTGFGSPADAPPGSGPSPAAPAADDGLKRAKVEAEGEEREQPLNGGSGSGAEAGTAPGAAPLPAFLQKLKLAAIYGKGEKAPIASEEDKDCD